MCAVAVEGCSNSPSSPLCSKMSPGAREQRPHGPFNLTECRAEKSTARCSAINVFCVWETTVKHCLMAPVCVCLHKCPHKDIKTWNHIHCGDQRSLWCYHLKPCLEYDIVSIIFDFGNISAVKWLIAINCIQNKGFCSRNICTWTV